MFDDQLQEVAQQQSAIDPVKAPPRATINEPAKAADIYMNEYVISTAGKTPLIKTEGVYACAALTLYDSETKTGVLAHIHPGTDLKDALETLKSEFNAKGIPLSRLEARLIGAQSKDSDVDVGSIQKWITDNKINLKELDVNVPNRALNLVFDLRNGTVSNYIKTLPPNFSDQYKWEKIESEVIPFKIWRSADSLPFVQPVELPNDEKYRQKFKN